MVEGEETVLGSKINSLTVHKVLEHESDSKHLPPIELRHFDRNPAYLPKFIESFISKILFKPSFTDRIFMERLLSVLEVKQNGLQSQKVSVVFSTRVG